MTLQNILKEKKGTIVDIRSPEEFMGGNVVGSINIPLLEIPQRLEELKTLKQPLILCFASGACFSGTCEKPTVNKAALIKASER